jgi:hypothetical protein
MLFNRIVRRYRLAFLAITAAGLTVGFARSETPRLLWQDVVDRGNFDQAFDVALLPDSIFVAGFVGAFNNRDFIARAYDARNGTPRWESVVNAGTNAFASGITATADAVFVSGVVLSDWLVRALDTETGELLWEDRFDRSGRSDSPRPGAIAVSEGLLFVVGSADSFSVWVVRAYEAATGRLVWQDQLAVNPGLNGAESLVVEGGRVFVGGFGTTPTSDDLIVRSYEARTGRLLWEHRTPTANPDFATLRGLGSDGRRIFAAGTVANASGKFDLLVLALDFESGMPLWTDQVDRGGDFDAGNGIAVRGRRVFVQGHGGTSCIFSDSPPSDCDVFIRSYDGHTGTLLWETKAGTAGIDDQAPPQVVVAERGLLFGAWSANQPTIGPKGDWLVQAYRGSTGGLVWEDLLDTGGGITFEGVEIPLRVAVRGSRLFVVGRTVDVTNNWNFVVRAYHIGASSRGQ